MYHVQEEFNIDSYFVDYMHPYPDNYPDLPRKIGAPGKKYAYNEQKHSGELKELPGGQPMEPIS